MCEVESGFACGRPSCRSNFRCGLGNPAHHRAACHFLSVAGQRHLQSFHLLSILSMTNLSPTKLTAMRCTNILLVAIFMALLWLPMFDTLFGFDHSPAFNEKRLLAQYPQFKPGFDGLKKYFRGLEAYYNDHFGFRNQLIHWHIQLRMALFDTESSQ